MSELKKSDPKTLYVSRKVLNADEILEWAQNQGFDNLVPADKLHVTVIASKAFVDWMALGNANDWYPADQEFIVPEGGPRLVEGLGTNKAPVLMFSSSPLCYRHEQAKQLGASWDFQAYQPHITISYEESRLDLSKVVSFKGEIKLGPELFEEFNDNWVEDSLNKFNIIKVDSEAQMVYGWASVIKENGVEVIDTQNDIIKAEELIQATTEFMQDARTSLSMHKGAGIGQVVHSFPLVGDLMKSLGITCDKEGWIVGVKIQDPTTWAQVKSGELKAFSIGASAIREEV